MSTTAVVMLVVSVVMVWGGLVASILFMRAHPQVDAVEDPDLELADDGRDRLPRPSRDL